MNSRTNSPSEHAEGQPDRSDVDWPVGTVGPFPREWIPFMMRGGREGAEVAEMGVLLEDAGMFLEDVAC